VRNRLDPTNADNGDVGFDHTLVHGRNPVTRWMAANVAVAQDPAGDLKPAKDKSTERIDGLVATIMAIGRALVVQEQFVDTPMVIWT
jgi:phage terminase large subunit-like protein